MLMVGVLLFAAFQNYPTLSCRAIVRDNFVHFFSLHTGTLGMNLTESF